jgi:hypothetical protein
MMMADRCILKWESYSLSLARVSAPMHLPLSLTLHPVVSFVVTASLIDFFFYQNTTSHRRLRLPWFQALMATMTNVKMTRRFWFPAKMGTKTKLEMTRRFQLPAPMVAEMEM